MYMAMYLSIVVLAYLLGSIASAILVCKMMGLGDPRKDGSGNPGATNVLRLHGKRAAALTLAGDVLKGVPAIALLHYLNAADGYIAAAALAAFGGHLFPLYFGLHGGKGVATLVGVLLAMHWSLGAAFIAAWLAVAAISRYSSLAAMTAAVLTPLFCYLTLANAAYAISCTLMSAALLGRHQSNIKALWRGEEHKLGRQQPLKQGSARQRPARMRRKR